MRFNRSIISVLFCRKSYETRMYIQEYARHLMSNRFSRPLR